MRIKEKDKAFLLDAPILPSGLFGDTVNTVIDRYQEAKKQLAAFRELIPCQIQEPAPSTSRSRSGPSDRPLVERTSMATPFTEAGGLGRALSHSRPGGDSTLGLLSPLGWLRKSPGCYEPWPPSESPPGQVLAYKDIVCLRPLARRLSLPLN